MNKRRWEKRVLSRSRVEGSDRAVREPVVRYSRADSLDRYGDDHVGCKESSQQKELGHETKGEGGAGSLPYELVIVRLRAVHGDPVAVHTGGEEVGLLGDAVREQGGAAGHSKWEVGGAGRAVALAGYSGGIVRSAPTRRDVVLVQGAANVHRAGDETVRPAHPG